MSAITLEAHLATGAPIAAAPRSIEVGVDALSIPAGEFTGDFYFAHRIGGSFWFALGDVAGKGLHAALEMALIQEEIERIITACASTDPAEVVASLHGAVQDELRRNRYATLVVGRIDGDLRLQIVNAGHCEPYLIGSDERIRAIGAHGPVVGILPSPKWVLETIELV
ncbi:MAG TPA: PP2C family protein-serine/threonine phosphatase, partial [Thermoanaerobaculia bacterium]|nr:PP2C family protein-serine/threonine phosphatase [Thermoanaerobaculia bacterium]